MKKQISELFSLPKEIVLNLPQIILTGQTEAVVENYRNIIEYTTTGIRINTNSGILKISGKNLTLKQMTAESITVTGIALECAYCGEI